MRVYEASLRAACITDGLPWRLAVRCCCWASGFINGSNSEFLPPVGRGGFVLDYIAPPGTSLAETDRQLLLAEGDLSATPDVESFSRRTGARLALSVAEPNTGDFLVKLKTGRAHSTEEVIAELRAKFNAALPASSGSSRASLET